MDDLDLLRDYAIRGDQKAFGLLVHRHIHLVHSAALRQVRDPHLAEDVAQAVFIILARKAASLPPGTIVAAWLLTAVRYASANAMRMRTRRTLHERRAGEAMRMVRNEWSNDPSDQAAWNDVAPLLDEAMAQLKKSDREALVLRFFQQKSIRDVGHALGVSEETAKKRVSRALERLRQLVAPKRYALPASALALLLSHRAVQAAPPNLAPNVSAGALSAECALAPTLATEIARSTVSLMAWSTTKWVACAFILVLLGVGPFLFNKALENAPRNTPAAASAEEPGHMERMQ